MVAERGRPWPELGGTKLSEAQTRDVGQALSGLTLNLDDAIDDEEYKLFATMQKALLAIGCCG